ncbi:MULTISPECIES: glycosyltransferase family 39 protein [Sorangium]|uniref:glycosyltransferase family 39 protein n=1 Tax=Sorangium TaxID=39643 RepID=UPI003D9C32ED
MLQPAPAPGREAGGALDAGASVGGAPASAAPFARDLAFVALAKAAVSALVLALGFRAVSDDDFARVVLAQAWAHAPRLDPTGTSWLPVPFWLNGALFLLFSSTLEVARAVAFALGVASAALVYISARWITGDRRAALAGALLAVAFPWSACLGVATVPELPAAALSLFAVASLVTPPAGPAPPAGRALLGALALVLATLSRYEPWPVAVAFAALALLAAARLGQGRAAQAKLALAALVALAGPAAWIAWNRVAHGEALHFLARVAAYRNAVSPGGDGTLLRLFAYPAAMVREEPELFLSPIAIALVAWRARRAAARGVRAPRPFPPLLRAALPYALPGAVAAFQIAALSLALVRDGAPTHHPERATLLALLLFALAVGDLTARAFRGASSGARWALGGALLVVLCVGLVFRPHLRREHFNPRTDEVAIGRAAAELTPPSAPVLVEVVDYGHLATLAALGRPGGAHPDRSIDPRDPPVGSSFDDPASLARRVADVGAAYLIGRVRPSVSAFAGPPLETRGAWGLWAAPATSTRAAPPAGPAEGAPGRAPSAEAAP